VTKAELISSIISQAKEIMSKLDTEEKRNAFIAYLTDENNNPNCRYTLNFIGWCSTATNAALNRRDKDTLHSDYLCVKGTAYSFKELENRMKNEKEA